MSFEPTDLVEHLDALHRYALGMTRDPHLADDLVHDVVVRAIERRDQYRGGRPAAALADAHDAQPDRGPGAAEPAGAPRRGGRGALARRPLHGRCRHVIERASAREELEDALARLPFAARAAVLLHDVEGYRVSEIAELQQVSLPAAKQRLRRGRMALVTALAEGSRRRTLTRGVPMRCWDARQHVSDYMNGDLDAATAAGVEAHLAGCPTCPPLYAALVGVSGRLGGLRDPDTVINPALADRLRLQLGSGPG